MGPVSKWQLSEREISGSKEWIGDMAESAEKAEQVDTLLATPDLAGALESEQFRHFLDQVPIAIIVAEMKDREECIVYANPEFEKLVGQSAAEVEKKPWRALEGRDDGGRTLGAAVVESSDCVGTFRIERGERQAAVVDVYSNIIQNDDSIPAFRLVALVDVSTHHNASHEELTQRIRE